MSSSSGLIPNPRDSSSGKAQTLGLNCPLCKKAFQVTSDMLGKKVVCPHCQKQIATPSAQQVESSAASTKKSPGDKRSRSASSSAKDKRKKSTSSQSRGESPTDVPQKRKRSKSPEGAAQEGSRLKSRAEAKTTKTTKTSRTKKRKTSSSQGEATSAKESKPQTSNESPTNEPPVLPPAVGSRAAPTNANDAGEPTAPPVIPPAPPVVPVVGSANSPNENEGAPPAPPVLAPISDQEVVTLPPAKPSNADSALNQNSFAADSAKAVPPPVDATLLSDDDLVEPKLEKPPETVADLPESVSSATLLTDEELVEPDPAPIPLTAQDDAAVSAALVESSPLGSPEATTSDSHSGSNSSNESLLPPMVGETTNEPSSERTGEGASSEADDLLPPSADSPKNKSKGSLKQVAIPNEGEEADPFATAPEDVVLLPDGEGGFVKSSARYVVLESGEDKVQLRRLDRKQKNAVRSLKSIIIYGFCIAMLVGAIIVLQVLFGGGSN